VSRSRDRRGRRGNRSRNTIDADRRIDGASLPPSLFLSKRNHLSTRQRHRRSSILPERGRAVKGTGNAPPAFVTRPVNSLVNVHGKETDRRNGRHAISRAVTSNGGGGGGGGGGGDSARPARFARSRSRDLSLGERLIGRGELRGEPLSFSGASRVLTRLRTRLAHALIQFGR